MAFSTGIIHTLKVGNRYVRYGTYESTEDDEGGDIDTKFKVCYSMTLQPTGETVSANQPVVNETFPCDGHAVTVITDPNGAGVWLASGVGL